ncbi:hypothetical protein GDO86_002052 [Hymenochirus boettgeri]|uniref:P2X purinoceptor n=1 Tax=Hymenochirus boettgeri TaxID=247094 RepID=A0A8T2KP05_9PIPI|nr:hypothetical protein GDO86_002052 [Hymenochirus boettgeri]
MCPRPLPLPQSGSYDQWEVLGSCRAMARDGCCGQVFSCIFDYDTPRIALIKSRKVGLLNRIIQLGILAYVIGWVFVREKGYQDFDTVVSSVTSKVKGVAVTNTTELGVKIWDVADYIIPAQLPDSNTICTSEQNCTPGYVGTHSNGIQTGKCVPYNSAVKTCEIFAWCPVENDTYVPMPAFLKEAENFTVLIKNNILYPKFNFSKRNILPNISTSYLNTCMYDKVNNPFCPIFRLGSLVNEAGESFQNMAIHGGVMGIQINWDCDLDTNAKYCVPKYSFRRLDNREQDHNVSPGYNFRFAKYYKDNNGVESRTLMKVYGIRFDVLVFGTAGKFDIIPTMINIGSGVALFGVATVLCDIIVFHFFKKRHYYREKKYKYVEDYDELIDNESSGSSH